MRLSSWGHRAVALALLGVGACLQSKVPPKPKPQVVAGLELRVDAPGMSPEQIEQMVVVPIELALVGNSDIREIVSEANEGRARLSLALSNRAELVAPDVLLRVTDIESKLPEGIGLPTLLQRELEPITLHFILADAHGEAAQTLLRTLQSSAGVREVSGCGLDREVVIELDPDALLRTGVMVGEVERALRSLTLDQLAVEELAKIEVKRVNGVAIRIADLATVELAAAGCSARSDQGRAVSISVTVAHEQAKARVDALLNDAQANRVVAQRFASRLHIWLAPQIEPERVVERIASLVPSPWLVELGVEGQPCEGPGTLVRLHLSDGVAIDAIDGIAQSLEAMPEIALVERADAPRARRWQHGAEAEAGPERVIDIDREKLTALGLDHASVMRTISAALAGIEVGPMREIGPVRLRLGSVTEDRLAELPIAVVGKQTVSLGMIAELRSEHATRQICRHDGERGVMIVDQR